MIIANYNAAKIYWQEIQMSGLVSGYMRTNIGSNITGRFQMIAISSEDLISGTEREQGNITLIGMSPSNLTSTGEFRGNSTIPLAGSQPCSSSFGFPAGTCTMTGL